MKFLDSPRFALRLAGGVIVLFQGFDAVEYGHGCMEGSIARLSEGLTLDLDSKR